jgi:hypothetical protein
MTHVEIEVHVIKYGIPGSRSKTHKAAEGRPE